MNNIFKYVLRQVKNLKNKLKLINMADIVPEEVHWVWYPYIPYDKRLPG